MAADTREETVFSTPWFQLVARSRADFESGKPYYSIVAADYVTVLARTAQGEWVMVRQFRPGVQQVTLEFPAGHVEPAQTPEESARAELREETGYVGGRWTLLGVLHPDTARMSNRMWCFLADGVELSAERIATESGISTELCSHAKLLERIASGEFQHALHLAGLALAMLQHLAPK